MLGQAFPVGQPLLARKIRGESSTSRPRLPTFGLLCLFFTMLILSGCREVRVKSYATGITHVSGGNAIVVVRSDRELAHLGISSPVRFDHEFGVVLLMGPHDGSGWRQVVEAIHASPESVRVVAYERGPLDGGDLVRRYRTYTLWIIPNSIYRPGSVVEVVTPSNTYVASTQLP